MVLPNLLLKLIPRRQRGTLHRTLRTSEGLLKECGSGGRKHRDAENVCHESQPCKGVKKTKPKRCDGMMRPKSEEVKLDDLSAMCSRQAALDCARQIEELQKKWEAVARAAERAEVAAQRAESSKRASGCPVKPPPQQEKQGSSLPILLGLMAVIAGVVYWLYTQTQEGEGEDKEKKKTE